MHPATRIRISRIDPDGTIAFSWIDRREKATVRRMAAVLRGERCTVKEIRDGALHDWDGVDFIHGLRRALAAGGFKGREFL